MRDKLEQRVVAAQEAVAVAEREYKAARDSARSMTRQSAIHA